VLKVKLTLFCRAAFVFDEGNNLGVSGKGQDFPTFKSFFNPDNRGFGYIKVQVMTLFLDLSNFNLQAFPWKGYFAN
jgi:hypothetical protein